MCRSRRWRSQSRPSGRRWTTLDTLTLTLALSHTHTLTPSHTLSHILTLSHSHTLTLGVQIEEVEESIASFEAKLDLKEAKMAKASKASDKVPRRARI